MILVVVFICLDELAKHLSVFNLLGLCSSILERKTSQGYMQKGFLIIGDYKKIWNRAKIFFWCALSIAPFFSQSSVFQLHYLLKPQFDFVQAVSTRVMIEIMILKMQVQLC